MDKTRKIGIINAAMKAFAAKDYHKVSTNDIVKEAGVSKGLLFHYFSSKESLLLHVYGAALDVIFRETLDMFDDTEDDLFERLKALILLKRRAIKDNPLSTALIERVHAAKTGRIAEERRKIFLKYNKRGLEHVYARFDRSPFKQKDAVDEAFNVASWSFRRIEIEWAQTHRHKSFEEAFKILEHELGHYAEFFKTHFYA